MRKWITNIIYIFSYRLKLMNKLLISYICVIILPLVIFTLISYRDVSETLLEQHQYSSDLSIQQTSQYLDYIIDNLVESTEQIALHNTIPTILKHDAVHDLSPDVYQNYLTVTQLVEGLLPMDILYSAELFVDDNIYYAREKNEGLENITFLGLSSDYAMELDAALADFYGEVLLQSPRVITNTITGKETVVISGSRYLKDSLTYSNIGILTINIEQQYLNSIVSRAAILSNSLAMLVDKNGQLLAVSDAGLWESSSLSTDLVLQNIVDENSSLTVEHQKLLLNSNPLESTGWTLISILPYDEILKTSVEARNRMLIVMLIIGSLFFFVAYYISKLITRRIRTLSSRIKSVRFDDFSPITSIEGTDEICDLVQDYNYMLEKINDYANSQYQLGIDLKNSELKALQAQINPHFLYNTLDLIHWISINYGAEEISEIVLLLSRFYKLTLNSGKDVMPLETALQHIEVYVKLQNYRFDDSIQLKIHSEPEVYEYSILNLLLQPIVENAIIHGILETEKQTGTITIEGSVLNHVLRIRITDDGIGMTKEQIERLTDTSDINVTSSYGIKNVIQRIKLCYGSKYGLTYESQPGRGTSVLLEIPCIKFTAP